MTKLIRHPTGAQRVATWMAQCVALVSFTLQAAAEPPAPRATTAPTAQLQAAGGDIIGTLGGRSSSYDATGNAVGSYAVLSGRGYIADVLPSGALGTVLNLVYATPDCSGAPAIEVSSVMGGPLPVPGYVFSFDHPRKVYNVPMGAAARTLTVQSVLQHGRDAYRCAPRPSQVQVYPLAVNRRADSGFDDSYAAPLAVRHRPIAQTVSGGSPAARPPNKETGAGAKLPLDTPQCAPGCFSPYIGDGICESECANSLCAFDGGDCKADFVERAKKHEAQLCAPACDAANLGDGFCDATCDVAQCEFDHGDCKAE